LREIVRSAQPYDFVLYCPAYHIGSAAKAQLMLEVVSMDLGGFGANRELLGDILAGRALGNQAQDLAFATGKRAVAAAGRCHASDVAKQYRRGQAIPARSTGSRNAYPR
jgi:hypothetical protein